MSSLRDFRGRFRLMQELQPEVWAQFERTLDQAKVVCAVDQLLVSGPIRQPQVRNGRECEFKNAKLFQRSETAIREELLGRIV